MAKEKKSSQANLVERTTLFTGLLFFGFLLIIFLAYFTLFFGVSSLGSYAGGDLDEMVVFIMIASLSMLILLSYGSFKNARLLWAQWRRKQAITEEAQRVSRLMDEKAETDNISEMYPDEKEAERKTLS